MGESLCDLAIGQSLRGERDYLALAAGELDGRVVGPQRRGVGAGRRTCWESGSACLPSGYKQVNIAWTWGALLAANIAAWLHQLTGVRSDDRADLIVGHGVRGGKAMIATLRHQLIEAPARLIRHARTLTLRPAPATTACWTTS